MRTEASVKLTVSGKPRVEVGGGTKDHSKLKNLSFEESGHTGFQKELTEEQLESLEIVKSKEDKSNKISSWDEYTGAENYPTCDMMSNFVSQEQGVTETNCNTYTDIQVSSLDEKVTAIEERVAANEEVITNAQADISANADVIASNVERILAVEDKSAQNETNIATHYEVVETQISGHENRIAELEIGMGDIETALDNIIAIQETLIGGDSV